MERIPVAGPWITEKEVQYVADAARNAWYTNASSYLQRFEGAFAEYVGVRHAVSLPSCTSAIHLSLLALGVGPGDEVIVPDITWIASAAPVGYVRATTVFADIDPSTWCLSVESFEQCITPRTKAVIPVDLYGGMPDMRGLLDLARRRDILVIEDAAEAVGAEFQGKKAGSFGDAGVFSFHGSKMLTTGEGGMLVTDRPGVLERVQVLRDHGRRPGDKSFVNTEVAYKYKMSSLQAAMGCGQLERIDELLTKKRVIFKWYQERLGAIRGVTLNAEPIGTRNSYWMVTAIIDPDRGLSKVSLMAWLDERGIDSRPFFYPLSSLPAYAHTPQAEAAQARNVNAYRLSPYGINLPSALNIDEGQVDYVCRTLVEGLGR